MKVMNGLDLQSQKIISLADPSANTDAANKQYVDNVARGLQWKAPCRVASTATVTLATPGTTIDGVTLAANDRVLLKNQTAPAENGIWLWTGAATPLTRASDADGGVELAPGTTVTVTEGTTNADKVFMIISDAAITVGISTQSWGQLGGGASYSGTNGVSVSGSSITGVAAASGGLTAGVSGFALDTSVAVRKVSANLGNGSLTAIAVSHSLGTKDITVAVRDAVTDVGVLVDWTATDINTVTLNFAVPPAANAYRVTVHG
ncbi:MAG: phage Phrappuccino [Pseudomonadota bacterium]